MRRIWKKTALLLGATATFLAVSYTHLDVYKRQVVLSMDIKRVDGGFRLFAKGGREDTGIDALAWAKDGVARGAGELVVNSIDTDGVKGGFDLELLDAVAQQVDVPIIASGGAGKMEDFAALFQNPKIDAGLAASIFHFKQVAIPTLKQYLQEQGFEMRR